ncbi:MAG: response regulator [Caldilineaceae bacterium]
MTQRILLLLDNKENARILRARLAAHHAAICVSEIEQNLSQPLDLIIVDGPTLNRAGASIQARKQADTPLFLPILLIVSRQDAGLQTRQLWQSVDELITLPVERTELEARIEVLLRTRRQSIELQQRSDELAALTEALVQRQKLESIGVLAGGMAHDFNNIFQAVLGRVELALLHLDPDHPAAQHIETVIPSLERAAGLTRQLMAYAGLGKYFVQAENLAQIVRDTEALARAALPAGARLEFSMPARLPSILADRSQVQQVLMNLVVNAGEALVDGQGSVSISLGSTTAVAGETGAYVPGAEPATGEYVFLQVADTGTGMDADTLARACEPFFSTRFTGRGMGLAAVLGIMRSHGGGLSLKSEHGIGTTVTALWPLAASPSSTLSSTGPADPAAAIAAVPTETLPQVVPQTLSQSAVAQGTAGAAAEQAAGRRRTTLVVDDEAIVLQALTEILDLSGIPVLTAANGQEAVEVYGAHRDQIGLVLIDMLMPVMNGGEALREMRKLDPTVPIVIASGYDDHEIKRHLDDAKISELPDAVLQKPFDIRTIREIAGRFLS